MKPPLTRCSQLPTAYVQRSQERHPVTFAQTNQIEQYLPAIWPTGHQSTLLVSFPPRCTSYAMYPSVNCRSMGPGLRFGIFNSRSLVQYLISLDITGLSATAPSRPIKPYFGCHLRGIHNSLAAKTLDAKPFH